MLNRAELHRFQRLTAVIPGGCWVWKGETTRDGYGVWRRGPGRPREMAYRVSYEHHVGDIPEGLDLDHACHTAAVQAGTCQGGIGCPHRRCVNYEHLEPVSRSENIDRSNHAGRRKTHCPAGHEYTETNTRLDRSGKRHCRACGANRPRSLSAGPRAPDSESESGRLAVEREPSEHGGT